MKKQIGGALSLLLCLFLLLSCSPAALAASPESIIDEDALNAWIADFVRDHDLSGGGQDFSVGFCYTATGDYWYYHGDIFMYSASMYKVPISMLLAEKEAAGELRQDSLLGGSTLKYLESSALIDSNNASGHAMLAYLGEDNSGKGSRLCIRYTSLSEDYFDPDFFDYSYYSARFITQVMYTLYQGGEERFPHVLENMLAAQPDSYMNLKLRGKYQVAQKYGAFEERNGSYNNHITAIIYTPTPIIVTVMTRNVGNFMPLMAEIGEYLANYSLQLDELLAAREAAHPDAEEPKEQPGLFPGLPSDLHDAAEAGEVRPAPGETNAYGFPPGAQIEGGRERLMPVFYLLWAAILLLAALVAYHALRTRRGQPLPAGASGNKSRPAAASRPSVRRETRPASRGRH